MNTHAQALAIEDWSKLEPVHDPSLIILLDLNNTLVSGPRETVNLPGKTYGDKIPHENYRLGLVELIKGHTVLLYTVRNDKRIEAMTLRNDCGGSAMAGSHTKRTLVTLTVPPAPLSRELISRQLIFPKYGKPDQQKVLCH